MIIDSHCHAGKGDGLTGPWDTDAPLGPYLARARAAGIDRTVLFPAFSSDYRSANAGVGRVVSGQPGRFSGYAMVDAARDRGRIRAMVAEAVTGWVRAASRCTGTTPASPGRSARPRGRLRCRCSTT